MAGLSDDMAGGEGIAVKVEVSSRRGPAVGVEGAPADHHVTQQFEN